MGTGTTMPKITIYVPDGIADSVKRWKDRLNYSELFREAFLKAVIVEEDRDRAEAKLTEDERRTLDEITKKRLEREAEIARGLDVGDRQTVLGMTLHALAVEFQMPDWILVRQLEVVLMAWELGYEERLRKPKAVGP